MAVAVQRWPLVGRRSELEVFERALGSGTPAGLVIFGPAGVGKTRLADECLAQAAAARHPVERVVGSRTTADLPLGAVGGLLATGLDRLDSARPLNMVSLFEETRRGLAERHQGRRVVTVADDAPLLDPASVALLDYLAAQRAIFLVATVRTGEAISDLLTGMWRDGRMERIDLGDLSPTGLDTVLHLALGGPMEAGAQQEFWTVTAGNPLYVRELVLGGLASGALVERSGVWHLEGPLSSTSRLFDLVEHRIGVLPEQARSLVELLAQCQPLELSYLETAFPAEVLESLERAGLVAITESDWQVRLAHPLHGEVVRAAMPRSRARSILIAESRRLEAVGEPGPAVLRIAMWRLEAGERPAPAVLVRGARLARSAHDFKVVRRMIEAIPAAELDAPAALLLGEALYELGAFDESERVLALGQGLAGDEQDALRLAVTRAKNANWGLCRPDLALEINASAQAVIRFAPFAEELLADEAAILMFSGHPDGALAVLAGLAGSDRRTRVVRAIVEAVALATAGHTAEAIAAAETGFAEHTALGDELAIAHPATHVVNQVFALTEAGRLAEAEQIARAGAEIVASHRVPIAQIWFAANLGRIATLQGKIATARRYYAEAAGLAQAHHFDGPRRLALSGVAVAQAMLGDAVAASQTVHERATVAEFGFLHPEQRLADAWTAVASHQPVVAAGHFIAAAEQARASGHRTAESWILHDLVRTSGRDFSARLGELAASCDSRLVTARARHAVALRTGDAAELSAVAGDFGAIGAVLLAAEAEAAAADAYRRAGDQRAATAARRRSAMLAEASEGAATPWLVHADSADPLSAREREIAVLAAEGIASKDIAERLFLSVRTVNNHLQHVYTKLGVTSRAELARALER